MPSFDRRYLNKRIIYTPNLKSIQMHEAAPINTLAKKLDYRGIPTKGFFC